MAEQTGTTTEKVEQPSFLEMSDEEMLNAAPPTVTTPVAEETPTTTEAAAKEVADGSTGATAPGDKKAADADAGEGKEEKLKVTGDPKDTGTEVKDVVKDTPEVKEEKPKEAAPAIDYEAEYKRLIAPFKANGREIQVNSVDDAVALMQMGANYNKKMAALKPNLKLMKMLENNGFLSEEKIGFLIDLGKKDPAAISKLVKDAGVDPMELDADKASAYKQNTYAVDDREIELDTVLDELSGSPTYNRTLDVVGNKWDVASKQVVSQNPQLLKLLNDHMAGGIYDLISAEIERDRLFGRLKGLSDIEAYRQVGDAIQARGGFDHLVKPKTETKPKAAEVVVPKPKAAEDDALKDKRRAASSTKTAAPGAAAKEFNPLAMSDEEISKLSKPVFN